MCLEGMRGRRSGRLVWPTRWPIANVRDSLAGLSTNRLARFPSRSTLGRRAVFLVEDKRHGTTYLVFTWEDPRKDGYSGAVIDDVSLDYDMEAVHSWPNGHPRPEACVGQNAN